MFSRNNLLPRSHRVFAGINNVFDEDFWAEVRDEDIVPAYRRNY